MKCLTHLPHPYLAAVGVTLASPGARDGRGVPDSALPSNCSVHLHPGVERHAAENLRGLRFQCVVGSDASSRSRRFRRPHDVNLLISRDFGLALFKLVRCRRWRRAAKSSVAIAHVVSKPASIAKADFFSRSPRGGSGAGALPYRRACRGSARPPFPVGCAAPGPLRTSA
jgi:hypothetical protein